MTEHAGAAETRAISPRLSAVLALAAGAAGVRLLGGGTATSVSGGVLLLVAALALAGVALGPGVYDPEEEAGLDLGGRLGLGLLGGLLGALVAGAVEWLFRQVGITAAYGVAVPEAVDGAVVGLRLLRGSVWGMVLGVLLPLVPGGSYAAKGAAFSLLPSLYVLLKVFPVDLDAGLFGVEYGSLTFLFVLAFNLVWALVAARVLAWGETTTDAPLTRPLGEPGGREA